MAITSRKLIFTFGERIAAAFTKDEFTLLDGDDGKAVCYNADAWHSANEGGTIWELPIATSAPGDIKLKIHRAGIVDT